MKRVYLDTNVISHVCRRDLGITEDQVKAFLRSIGRRITVPLSLITVEEISIILRDSPKEAYAQLALLRQICSPREILKPSKRMLCDAVRARLQGRQEMHFLKSKGQLTRTVWDFLQRKHQPAGMEVLFSEIERQKSAFKGGCEAARTEFRENVRSAREKPPDFEEFCNSQEVEMAQVFLARCSLPRISEEKVTDLLEVPSLRAFSRYQLSLYYSQMVEGRAPDDGDSRDTHHALLASTADYVISHDKAFRFHFGRIGIERPRMFRFSEFVERGLT